MRNEKGEIGEFFLCSNVGENISSAMRDLCMDSFFTVLIYKPAS